MSTRTRIQGSAGAWRFRPGMFGDDVAGRLRGPGRSQPGAALGEVVARIHRPGRAATQSGRARAREWILEFEPRRKTEVEPLMGWIACDDPLQQITLRFPDRESAVRFARRHGWRHTVDEPLEHPRRTHSYAENFRWRGGRVVRD